ncbi:hypothetical protein FrEUN1fDRAFT_5380 [Parafrankia sp. EUN1f]|nr:hypothetical protein FrEUN1fDRAFT_5380 [Parafrankia sp. EUN1f]
MVAAGMNWRESKTAAGEGRRAPPQKVGRTPSGDTERSNHPSDGLTRPVTAGSGLEGRPWSRIAMSIRLPFRGRPRELRQPDVSNPVDGVNPRGPDAYGIRAPFGASPAARPPGGGVTACAPGSCRVLTPSPRNGPGPRAESPARVDEEGSCPSAPHLITWNAHEVPTWHPRESGAQCSWREITIRYRPEGRATPAGLVLRAALWRDARGRAAPYRRF